MPAALPLSECLNTKGACKSSSKSSSKSSKRLRKLRAGESVRVNCVLVFAEFELKPEPEHPAE